MPRSLPAIFSLTLLFLAGCAAWKPDFQSRQPSPDVLNEQLLISWEQFASFESQLTLTIQNSQFNGSLFGTLQMQRPGQLALSLKAPFGIPVGALVVSGGQYEAVFANGRFDSGAVEEFDLATLIGIPFSPEDVLRLFEPFPRPLEARMAEQNTLEFSVEGPDSLWRWRLADSALVHQILYNPEKGVVTSEQWFNPADGVLLLRKEYRQIKRINRLNLAGEVITSSGGAFPATVRIQFENLELNPEWTSNPFQLRSNGG